MAFNEELALKAVARIEADPKAWRQSTWHDDEKSVELGRPVGCFALHVCLAAGLEVANLETSYFKATEATDALGLGRAERAVVRGEYSYETHQYEGRVMAEVVTAGEHGYSGVDSIAFKLLGVEGDSYGGDVATRAMHNATGACQSLADIKRLVAKAAGKGLPEYRIRHQERGEGRYDTSIVNVSGKDAVRAFLANVDVDKLVSVSVELIDDED